jgi:WD40 repeat protein
MVGSQAVNGSTLPTLLKPELLIQISPDSNWIASQLTDGTLLIWRPADGGQIASLQTTSPASFASLTISPDSKWIVAGSFLGMVHVWNAITNVEQIAIQTQAGGNAALALTFTPDEKWIIVTDGNAVEKLRWHTEDLIYSSCARFLTRNLYTWEWTQYLGHEPYRATCPNHSTQPVPTATSGPTTPVPTFTPYPYNLFLTGIAGDQPTQAPAQGTSP